MYLGEDYSRSGGMKVFSSGLVKTKAANLRKP